MDENDDDDIAYIEEKLREAKDQKDWVRHGRLERMLVLLKDARLLYNVDGLKPLGYYN